MQILWPILLTKKVPPAQILDIKPRLLDNVAHQRTFSRPAAYYFLLSVSPGFIDPILEKSHVPRRASRQ